MKGARVGPQLKEVAAIFAPAGLWIAVSATEMPPTAIPQPAPGLDELLSSYQSSSGSSPLVHIKGLAVEQAVNTTAKSLQDVDLRTIHAYAVSGDAELIHKGWYDKVLGNGGTKVSLDHFYDLKIREQPDLPPA
jgi:hypothetical protein